MKWKITKTFIYNSTTKDIFPNEFWDLKYFQIQFQNSMGREGDQETKKEKKNLSIIYIYVV